VGIEEKRQARSKLVDIETCLDRRFDIGDAICNGEGNLLHCRGARLSDMVAGDRDGVPVRHLLRAIFKNIRDEPHRGRGRENIGAAGNVLFQYIVLDRPIERLGTHALLLGHGNVHRKEHSRRGVDRHARRHLVERDAVEQHLHVRKRIDGHTDLPHLAFGERVVRIVPYLRGQIEGHGKARLPLLEQVFVARVRFLGGAETGILSHRPQPSAIHGRLYAARIREFARQPKLAGIIEVFLVERRIHAVDGAFEPVTNCFLRSGYFSFAFSTFACQALNSCQVFRNRSSDPPAVSRIGGTGLHISLRLGPHIGLRMRRKRQALLQRCKIELLRPLRHTMQDRFSQRLRRGNAGYSPQYPDRNHVCHHRAPQLFGRCLQDGQRHHRHPAGGSSFTVESVMMMPFFIERP